MKWAGRGVKWRRSVLFVYSLAADYKSHNPRSPKTINSKKHSRSLSHHRSVVWIAAARSTIKEPSAKWRIAHSIKREPAATGQTERDPPYRWPFMGLLCIMTARYAATMTRDKNHAGDDFILSRRAFLFFYYLRDEGHCREVIISRGSTDWVWGYEYCVQLSSARRAPRCSFEFIFICASYCRACLRIFRRWDLFYTPKFIVLFFFLLGSRVIGLWKIFLRIILFFVCRRECYWHSVWHCFLPVRKSTRNFSSNAHDIDISFFYGRIIFEA